MTAPITARALRDRLRRAEPWIGPTWLWMILLAIVGAAWVLVPAFGTPRNLTNILVAAVPLAVVAIGQTVVILTGGIDISVAVVMSLGLTMSMGLMDGGEGNLIVALTAPILAGAVVGLVSGGVIVGLSVPPFMATLGVASIVQGVVFAYTGYATFGRPHPSVGSIGYLQWGPLPALVVLFVPLAVLTLMVQNDTRYGRYLYALGDDASSARSKGVPTRGLTLGVYVFSGCMAALAGIALATRQGGGEPLGGAGYEWNSVAAVVIGGTVLRGGRGGIAGTLLAVLVLGLVNNLLNLSGVSAFWQSAIRGGIVLVAVAASAAALLRPVDAFQLVRRAKATA